MDVLLERNKYFQDPWNICSDLKVVARPLTGFKEISP